jgi:TPR repeat protein
MGWYQNALNAGSDAAMFDIGPLYENGLGVDRDLDQALGWFRKAAASGSEPARGAQESRRQVEARRGRLDARARVSIDQLSTAC